MSLNWNRSRVLRLFIPSSDTALYSAHCSSLTLLDFALSLVCSLFLFAASLHLASDYGYAFVHRPLFVVLAIIISPLYLFSYIFFARALRRMFKMLHQHLPPAAVNENSNMLHRVFPIQPVAVGPILGDTDRNDLTNLMPTSTVPSLSNPIPALDQWTQQLEGSIRTAHVVLSNASMARHKAFHDVWECECHLSSSASRVSHSEIACRLNVALNTASDALRYHEDAMIRYMLRDRYLPNSCSYLFDIIDFIPSHSSVTSDVPIVIVAAALIGMCSEVILFAALHANNEVLLLNCLIASLIMTFLHHFLVSPLSQYYCCYISLSLLRTQLSSAISRLSDDMSADAAASAVRSRNASDVDIIFGGESSAQQLKVHPVAYFHVAFILSRIFPDSQVSRFICDKFVLRDDEEAEPSLPCYHLITARFIRFGAEVMIFALVLTGFYLCSQPNTSAIAGGIALLIALLLSCLASVVITMNRYASDQHVKVAVILTAEPNDIEAGNDKILNVVDSPLARRLSNNVSRDELESDGDIADDCSPSISACSSTEFLLDGGAMRDDECDSSFGDFEKLFAADGSDSEMDESKSSPQENRLLPPLDNSTTLNVQKDIVSATPPQQSDLSRSSGTNTPPPEDSVPFHKYKQANTVRENFKSGQMDIYQDLALKKALAKVQLNRRRLERKKRQGEACDDAVGSSIMMSSTPTTAGSKPGTNHTKFRERLSSQNRRNNSKPMSSGGDPQNVAAPATPTLVIRDGYESCAFGLALELEHNKKTSHQRLQKRLQDRVGVLMISDMNESNEN